MTTLTFASAATRTNQTAAAQTGSVKTGSAQTGPLQTDSAQASSAHFIRFSARVPTLSDMAAEVAIVRELAEPGARVVVTVPGIIEPDTAAARQRRTTLELLDALSGLRWQPTRLIGSADQIAEQAEDLARVVDADEVRYRG